MQFIRALNNNAGIASDASGRDVVIFGKGLAFSLKAGDAVPEESVERAFYERDATILEELLKDIPEEHFDLSCEIIEYIQNNLGVRFNGSLYITLMDHISFVKTRAEQDMLPKNPLTWEISRYYPVEFKLCKKVVKLLEDEFACRLSDDEAASLALHIINAEQDLGHVHTSMKAVKLVDDILQIIRFQAKRDFDVSTLSYQRLLTHIKFFVQRVLQKKEKDVTGYAAPVETKAQPSTAPLAEMIKASYPDAYSIADRVRMFAEAECAIAIDEDETSYLTINIQRVLDEGGER